MQDANDFSEWAPKFSWSKCRWAALANYYGGHRAHVGFGLWLHTSFSGFMSAVGTMEAFRWEETLARSLWTPGHLPLSVQRRPWARGHFHSLVNTSLPRKLAEVLKEWKEMVLQPGSKRGREVQSCQPGLWSWERHFQGLLKLWFLFPLSLFLPFFSLSTSAYWAPTVFWGQVF